MNNKELEAIGLRIRERRMALDLTQTALAQRLGITAQAVSKWETGMGCPDIYVLPKLASALEISTDALLGLAPMPAVDPEKLRRAQDAQAEETAAPEEEQEEKEESVTEKDVMDAPSAPDFFSDGEQAFRDAEAWVNAFTEAPKKEEEPWIPHLTTDPDEEEEQAQEPEHAADPVYTVHKDEYTPRPREYVHGEKAQEEKTEEKTSSGQNADSGYHYNYTNYRTSQQNTGYTASSGGTGRAPYSNIPPYSEAPRQDGVPGFDGSALAHDISRMVNSAVRAAMGAAKTAKDEVQRAAAGTESVQHGFGNGALLRGLNLDIAGSGEVIVHAGLEAPWHAEIRAPEVMFTRIVCQEEDGTLYVRIPQASQFGFFGFTPQVRVEIFTGFTLGENIAVNIRGSADTKIEPDFAHSDVRIAGSGDVTMHNAGKLTYSVAGSGDFTFENAEDATIRISGSSDVDGGCLTGNTSIHISGSGDFSADAVIGTLEAVSTGSGDFEIDDGNLEMLRIRCAGSGDFYAPALETVDAEIRISGSGDVVIGRVSGRLEQHLSRVASLRIKRP